MPRRAHGKEGVDGSSPSEGSARPRTWGFSFGLYVQIPQRATGMESLMEPPESRRRPVRDENERFLHARGAIVAASRHDSPRAQAADEPSVSPQERSHRANGTSTSGWTSADQQRAGAYALAVVISGQPFCDQPSAIRCIGRTLPRRPDDGGGLGGRHERRPGERALRRYRPPRLGGALLLALPRAAPAERVADVNRPEDNLDYFEDDE